MPSYSVEYRIKDFLQRQIAWSRAVLGELDAFCATTDDADFDPVLENQQRRERETRDMAKEYRGLAREWAEVEAVTPEDRDAIKRLSAEAEALVEQVRARYTEAERHAALRRDGNRGARDDLRRGRRSVNIYRPGALVSPGFVDRKA